MAFIKLPPKKNHVFHYLLDFVFRTNQNMQYISLTGTKPQSFHQTSSDWCWTSQFIWLPKVGSLVYQFDWPQVCFERRIFLEWLGWSRLIQFVSWLIDHHFPASNIQCLWINPAPTDTTNITSISRGASAHRKPSLEHEDKFIKDMFFSPF